MFYRYGISPLQRVMYVLRIDALISHLDGRVLTLPGLVGLPIQYRSSSSPRPLANEGKIRKNMNILLNIQFVYREGCAAKSEIHSLQSCDRVVQKNIWTIKEETMNKGREPAQRISEQKEDRL